MRRPARRSARPLGRRTHVVATPAAPRCEVPRQGAIMKLAVFGATGGTGRQILAQALADGHNVAALVRDTTAVESRPGLRLLSGDCSNQVSISEVVLGQDA